ncbi:membrane protein insertion efficiency factor YidD [Hyphomonas sp. NPDC076900]|uniref:membrane protein insertion efficiency factor YidD n=1 Tax=unclassified Hyphomonas TaxID=2630699 RepID=UPI003CFF1802
MSSFLTGLVHSLKFRIRLMLVGVLQTTARASSSGWCYVPVVRPVVVLSIRLYRLTLSHFVGQDCLFCPTCSRRALDALVALPFQAAMRETVEQVMGCNPNYVLFQAPEGWVMRTSNGRTFMQSDLSPAILQKITAVEEMSKQAAGATLGASVTPVR